MRAVSDTSPLSCLASLQRLDLLWHQFEEVWVPPAVERELRHHSHSSAAKALREAISAGKIRVETVRNAAIVASLTRTLDLGEAESIALASQVAADFLLVDERDGRELARRLEIPISGTVGILMKAKLDGRLNSLRSALMTLREVYAFSLAPELVDRVLQEVGEA